MRFKSGPSHPIVGDKGGFIWPDSELNPAPDPTWNFHRSPDDGRCFCCRSIFTHNVYDVLVEKPDKWALLCHGCFVGMRCDLGPGKGQRYVREEKSEWRAVGHSKFTHEDTEE